MVRSSVDETLNALLDAEADRLRNAPRYERSEARRDCHRGKIGVLVLNWPIRHARSCSNCYPAVTALTANLLYANLQSHTAEAIFLALRYGGLYSDYVA